MFKLYYLLYFMDPNVIIIYAADLHCILRHIWIPRYIDTHLKNVSGEMLFLLGCAWHMRVKHSNPGTNPPTR